MKQWWTARPRWQQAALITAMVILLLAIVSSVVEERPSAVSSNSAAVVTSTIAIEQTTTSSRPSTTTTKPPVLGTERATVTKFVDGDTVDVRIVGGSTDTVRLIGINTPERGECFADEASAELEGLLGPDEFVMTTDVSDRDRYDRLLRYIWLDSGVFVNEEMIGRGFALARDYPPDSEYAHRLAAAQAEAESNGVGLWATDACGIPTDGSLQIMHIRYDAPGNDNENLNEEWVDITNLGDADQDMAGWTLKDESASHRYQFPLSFILDSRASVRVHTGCGTDTATDLYWCGSGAVWNNSGDTGFLLDPRGNIVDHYSY
jgi:micrococcal nuclease